ncbi:MAG: phytoene/squalene synthase family protein [Thermaceae bacterium]
MEPNWKKVAQVIRRHSATFHLASRFFRPKARKAAWAVYAACRLGDDAVDESPTPRESLEDWWKGVERSYAGRPLCPWEEALAWTLERIPLPFQAFLDLKAGFLRDLEPVEVQDEEDLLQYSYQVAGTVGLLMAKVAGAKGGEEEAIALGQAMQITNILRDVGEDLRRGRLYLPQTLLRRYGVRLEDLLEGRPGEGYFLLTGELARLARGLYQKGLEGLPKLQTGRPAVALAALQYRGILDKLERKGFPNLRERVHLAPLERVFLLPRIALRLY